MAKARKDKQLRRKAKLPELGLDLRATLTFERAEPRDADLHMRVTATQQRQLREMADHFGTTVTNYLMTLHERAWEALHEKGGR